MSQLIELKREEVEGKAILPYVPRSRGQPHYADSVSRAILRFHSRPRLDWADLYARLMQTAVPIGAECITFPPQAADADWTAGRALAEALGRLIGAPCLDLVFYAGPPRGKAPKVKCPKDLTNQRIVVVDDIWRTGNTMATSAEALRTAGAKYVSALCLAKVVPRERSPDEIKADQKRAREALRTVGRGTGRLASKADFVKAVADIPSVVAAHGQPISHQLWRIGMAVEAYAQWAMENLDGAAPLYGDRTESRDSFQGFTDALMGILRRGPFAKAPQAAEEEFPVDEGLTLLEGDENERKPQQHE